MTCESIESAVDFLAVSLVSGHSVDQFVHEGFFRIRVSLGYQNVIFVARTVEVLVVEAEVPQVLRGFVPLIYRNTHGEQW